MPYFHHSKNLRICARKLNNNPTSAERMRWYGLLTNKQFGDDRFLRQWIIDRYILDFFCKELKLIVEVDGISHDHEEVYERDRLRENIRKKVVQFDLNDINTEENANL
ncbi:MAG: DUF559 domain-containing protein [Saprospiraceae bacterium]|nr:DUF559 domain-containing protein [Saprospiraceae bacterium]